MSLLFEYAVNQFSLADASLHTASEATLSPSGRQIPVRPIATFASHHDELSHPDREWTCIPLHSLDTATPTGEFVAYTDHEVRGEIFIVEQDGDIEPIAADEFGATQLADRIRFWHSDYLPETYPPGYDAPIDDHEDPRHPVANTDLLTEFRDYITNERAATRASHETRARNHSARALYEQGGSAIPELTCRGVDDGEYRFRVTLDPELEDRRDGDWAYFIESEFDIYQDNEVLIHADSEDAPDPFPVPAEVARIRGLTIWLTIKWGSIDDTAMVSAYLEGDHTVGCSELLNPVPFNREFAAIDDLQDDPFREVLVGDRPLTFSNEAAAMSASFDDELNQEQQLAVEYALLADDLFCIHGPPGTGKTRTLVEIIRRAVAAGEDVLVCADSNQALDNLVVGNSTPGNPDAGSLHAYGQHGTAEFTLDRVNAERSAHDIVRTQYHDVTERAEVVAATNSSAATLAREFTLLVLDEATQATCTASCIPLARVDRAVLAGDHRQLPPFSATEDPPVSSYGLSLFEHVYADGGVYEGVGLQLKTQYRMHPDIAYFSNRQFYDRSLRTGRVVKPLEDKPAIEGYDIGGTVDVIDHSRANEAEAHLVVHLVQDILKAVPPEEVGVITPYAAHAWLLRDLLNEQINCANAITVDTIDSFQGSEKTAVVISLVRSNAEGDIGFLGRPDDGPRRLNVALTRAKRYCAVVGDFHTLRYDTDGKCTGLYRDFRNFFESTGRLNDVDPAFL
ncbi:AAA domain-containing protein [Halapricum desulfuricans]|uniref:UvrD/REP helicase n=1 Tax=Halapricum desulfuricans TaxID=2841257 RepID=A0A897NTW9_9EURY|nr:AAA domain-containing protein [Halapricum desulfuricans]QSG16352.1 UvrD/REP helicase [Halapricum desulfuricans]